MVDRDITLLFIGTCLGLASAIIGALVQHFLSLRADEIKRKRNRKEKDEEIVRGELQRGLESIKPEDIAGLRMILKRLSPLLPEEETEEREQEQHKPSQ